MEKQEIVTLSVSDDTLKKAKEFYHAIQAKNGSGYLYSIVKCPGVTVSIYQKNKKGENKILFQGASALKEARIWDENAKPTILKNPLPLKRKLVINRYPQIGSDEVGTGDYFGPIIVVASYVRKEEVEGLLSLGVTDSKKMNDQTILSLGPTLIQHYDYSELALDNLKYNEIHDEFNMNAIKAKMHNRCLLNLKKRHPESFIYQDQFAPEPLYYSYLKDEKEVCRNINFKAKGESAFISVALASVIARYAFLRKMKKMGEAYGVEFPLGAHEQVDIFAKSFIGKFGKEELKKVAKLNFSNTKRLL